MTKKTKKPDINERLEQFGLRIDVLPVGAVKPYEGNPRQHDLEALGASVSAFGFKDVVIVDADMEVIAGHGRLEAAKAKGLTEVPVLIALDLDKIKAKAYRLAHNSVVGEWDIPALQVELTELRDEGFDLAGLSLDGEWAEGENDHETGKDPGDGRYKEQYGVIIICDSEEHQEKVYAELHESGYNCKVVVT